MKTIILTIILTMILLTIEFMGMPKSYFILQSVTYGRLIVDVFSSIKYSYY